MELSLTIPDDEIRAKAAMLYTSAEHLDDRAEVNRDNGYLGAAASCRLNAAILRAAEQLGPEREPVTRETPGNGKTHVAHDKYGWGSLVGFTLNGDMVTETACGDLAGWSVVDGWYVVKGEQG